MTQKRTRRGEEQMILDLEAKIAALRARAARKAVKANPAHRHASAAVKSIDKALEAAEDATMRKALQEARATLAACLALDGVAVSNGSLARRSAAVSPEALLEHVKKHPGQGSAHIAAAFGTDSNSIRPVMQKLIAAKKVRTKGQKRATTYVAA